MCNQKLNFVKWFFLCSYIWVEHIGGKMGIVLKRFIFFYVICALEPASTTQQYTFYFHIHNHLYVAITYTELYVLAIELNAFYDTQFYSLENLHKSSAVHFRIYYTCGSIWKIYILNNRVRICWKNLLVFHYSSLWTNNKQVGCNLSTFHSIVLRKNIFFLLNWSEWVLGKT